MDPLAPIAFYPRLIFLRRREGMYRPPLLQNHLEINDIYTYCYISITCVTDFTCILFCSANVAIQDNDTESYTGVCNFPTHTRNVYLDHFIPLWTLHVSQTPYSLCSASVTLTISKRHTCFNLRFAHETYPYSPIFRTIQSHDDFLHSRWW